MSREEQLAEENRSLRTHLTVERILRSEHEQRLKRLAEIISNVADLVRTVGMPTQLVLIVENIYLYEYTYVLYFLTNVL